METSVLNIFEDFMQEPEQAWQLYRKMVAFADLFDSDAPDVMKVLEMAMSRSNKASEQVDKLIALAQDQDQVNIKLTESLAQANENNQTLSNLNKELRELAEANTDDIRSATANAEKALKIAQDALKQRDTAESRASLLEEKLARAQFQLMQLQRMIFGKKSEKFSPEQLNQLRLDIEADAIGSEVITGITDISYTKITTVTTPKKHPGRNPLPAHLRREELVLEPIDKAEGDVFVKNDVSETLEYIPGEFWVKTTIRPVYASKQPDGSTLMKQADLPVEAIDKCIAGASLLAYIVISKYIDSLPLYRQIEIFKRAGVEIASGTMSGWITKICELLEPLYELLKKEVLKAEYLNVDETTMKVIEKGAKNGKTALGYFWVYLHHWGKLVFYDYKPTRSGKVPETMLQDYKGIIQADGYQVYETIATKNGNILVCCMAHVRRKFEEIYKNNDRRAGVPLNLFNQLYAIEEECRSANLSFDEIKAVRQERSVPILDQLEAWLKAAKQESGMDAPMRAAINYALNRWDKLRLFAEHGNVTIDNNQVERAIRTVAIGRKNYLFSGSHEGAQRSAMLYSLTATCKLNGINPLVWLTDVMQRLAYLPKEDKYLELLLPQNWRPKLMAKSITKTILTEN
ncbi:Transposase [Mucilaginibacter pineti]|uniref:Transposase n=1 Tax=Mucilaginibacter pineti TaxID=1391627 RepID=A0A1G7IIB2_9SPHI|nr:IS66 family transposase [Mucilaginibacter pineti]SDF12328.1 Transposase [Mucilaginibacter pineti]